MGAPRISLGTSLLPLAALAFAGCQPAGDAAPGHQVLAGTSPLVALMNDAAASHDVPAELLAAVAWTETSLRPPPVDAHDHHGPGAAGVMGLPGAGVVRSVPVAAALLGVSEAAVATDPAINIAGAAAILRALADDLGDLRASGSRDRWLQVVARYFDAGAAGQALAAEVWQVAASGLVTTDADGAEFVIRSLATLYPSRAPEAVRRAGLAAEYPGATWVAADASNYSNASRRATDIDYVVIHTVQGSYAGAISWFRNSRSNVSAHYVVRRSDGAITQMLRNEDIGWHAGNSNYNARSIGIEHEGWVSDANNYTSAMLQASADLTRWLCDTYGIPKDRRHIVGHVEVPGATHTDPGPHFPWTEYMRLVNDGTSPPPPAGTGTLKGVVYVDGDTSRRVGGAAVTVSPGGHSATARASDGYWQFTLPAGTYTVSAAAAGYRSGQTTRSVAVGAEAWGSVSVTTAPSGGGTGQLKGVVYDARTGDYDTRIGGAVVRTNTGASVTADAAGNFTFDLAPGMYTFTASHAGWQASSLQRTVVVAAIEWGSIGLLPEGTAPGNRPPAVPSLNAPTGGAQTRTARPVFTVGDLSDPEGDALGLEVEIFIAGDGDPTSAGTVAVAGAARLVTWQHPRDDLPRDVALQWRVRATDATASSPWTARATFAVAGDGTTATADPTAWTAEVLPGVGTNAPPGAPSIIDPVDRATVRTSRPQIVAAAAADPEGDALAHQFQLATDDLFAGLEATSGLITAANSVASGPAWVVATDLAPSSTYYVRVRAADERVFGPWSTPVAFTVAADATAGPDTRPGTTRDIGGAPRISIAATPDDSGGCSATEHHGAGLLAPGWLLAGALLLVRRRRS